MVARLIILSRSFLDLEIPLMKQSDREMIEIIVKMIDIEEAL